MLPSEIAEKYLTRIIFFKEKQELFSDFIEQPERITLLKNLSDELGFDPKIWNLRTDYAARAFKTYEFLNLDIELNVTAFATLEVLKEKYIRRAIALDPYNIEYLKVYLRPSAGRPQRDEKLARHYVSMFHPNTTEFQNHLVDLNLNQNDVVFDYLSETVTAPFVNEMVFIQEQFHEVMHDNQTQKTLEVLAQKSGVEDGTLKKINDSIPGLLKTAAAVVRHPMPERSETRKASLAMEKALDLAPYDRDVLLTAISFYGGFYWRLILGYKQILGEAGNDEFAGFNSGSKKPKRNEIYDKAVESFRKAYELKNRLYLVVQNNAEPEKKKSDRTDYTDISWTSKKLGNALEGVRWLMHEDAKPAHIEAFFDRESLAIQTLTEHFKSSKGQAKKIILSAAIIAASALVLSLFVFDSFISFFPVFIVGFLIVTVMILIRGKMKQNKKMDIDEILDWRNLVY